MSRGRVTRSSVRLSIAQLDPPTPEIKPNKTRKPKKHLENVAESVKNIDNEIAKHKTREPTTPRKEKMKENYDKNSPATPPKQKKVEVTQKTPKTNKINNENAAGSPKTPSSLLSHLALTSPKGDSKQTGVTPSRKSLFQEGTPYQSARKALHSTVPTQMPGRQKELGELEDFITFHLENKSSGTMYISGPPGTGKTASLTTILKGGIPYKYKEVYVNCTAIKSASAIFSRIVNELKIKHSGRTEKDYLHAIDTYLREKHEMILLVLDEIDQLESKNQSVLYTIFEWPSIPNSRMILIGIANALDLTDRILPRLQARCELKPKLMHFAPYSKQQIVEIFKNRLTEAGVSEVFSAPALQMLAGKVASISGDVRRALDIGRRVVESIEQNRKDLALKSIENLADDILNSEISKADSKPVVADFKEVINVLNSVYGTSQKLTDDVDEAFPMQQKIIICSLLLLLKKIKKDITVGKLHDTYRKVCSKRHFFAVDQAEFVGLCSLIETKGILKLTGKKEPRLLKVTLEWDEEEVINALKDKKLISQILQDESCIGKV